MLFCLACGCYTEGSSNSSCNSTGQCTCETGYTGDKCDSCESEYYKSGSNCTGKNFVMIHIIQPEMFKESSLNKFIKCLLNFKHSR